MMKREYYAKMSDDQTITGEVIIPQQYAYKVSLLTDQKCVKPEITIYSNTLDAAITEAVAGLKKTRAALLKEGFVSAPLGEVKQDV